METLGLLHSESGSTLIQLLIGLAIMSAVGFSAAHITADTKRTEIIGDTNNAISQVHLVAIQKARNLTLLKSALYTAGVNLNVDSETTRCLSGAGINCDIYNSANFLPLSDFDETLGSTGGNTISNAVSYKLVCPTASNCDTLQLRVVTELSTHEFRRTTDLRFAGSILVDRAALSFACVGAAENVVTGIDFQTRRAVCTGIPITRDCAQGQPLVDLDAGSDPTCASMAQLDCGNGMKTVGLVGAQANAQGSCL